MEPWLVRRRTEAASSKPSISPSCRSDFRLGNRHVSDEHRLVRDTRGAAAAEISPVPLLRPWTNSTCSDCRGSRRSGVPDRRHVVGRVEREDAVALAGRGCGHSRGVPRRIAGQVFGWQRVDSADPAGLRPDVVCASDATGAFWSSRPVRSSTYGRTITCGVCHLLESWLALGTVVTRWALRLCSCLRAIRTSPGRTGRCG